MKIDKKSEKIYAFGESWMKVLSIKKLKEIRG